MTKKEQRVHDVPILQKRVASRGNSRCIVPAVLSNKVTQARVTFQRWLKVNTYKAVGRDR